MTAELSGNEDNVGHKRAPISAECADLHHVTTSGRYWRATVPPPALYRRNIIRVLLRSDCRWGVRHRSSVHMHQHCIFWKWYSVRVKDIVYSCLVVSTQTFETVLFLKTGVIKAANSLVDTCVITAICSSLCCSSSTAAWSVYGMFNSLKKHWTCLLR